MLSIYKAGGMAACKNCVHVIFSRDLTEYPGFFTTEKVVKGKTTEGTLCRSSSDWQGLTCTHYEHQCNYHPFNLHPHKLPQGSPTHSCDLWIELRLAQVVYQTCAAAWLSL